MNHISTSQVNTLDRCEMQWYFRYVKGMKAPPGIALVLGGAYDEALNVNFKQKVESQEDAKENVVTDAFVQEYQAKIKDADLTHETKDGESREKVVLENENDGLSMVKTFHNEHAKFFLPTAVQAKFTYKLMGLKGDWEVLGFIDHISRTVQFELGERKSGKAFLIPKGFGDKTSVYDNKTKSDTPNGSEVFHSWQLPNYSLGHYMLTGKYPEKTGLVFTTRPSKPSKKNPEGLLPKVVYQERVCTNDDTTRLMCRYSAAIKTMEALRNDAIEPKGAPEGSWLCSPRFCGYWDRCKLRRREL